MFRISFFVDDKNLGEAFKRLSGIAKNVEHVYVPNLESKPNGKLQASSENSQEMFIKEMRRRKWTYVNANGAREIVKEMGFSPASYTYMLQTLVKAGALKKTGTSQKMLYVLKEAK